MTLPILPRGPYRVPELRAGLTPGDRLRGEHEKYPEPLSQNAPRSGVYLMKASE